MNAAQVTPTRSDLSLIWALWYASQGFKVFPIAPLEKKPLTPRGLNDASVDEEQIRKWWGSVEFELSIGLPAPNGYVVIDVDVRNEGDKTYVQLLTERGLPATRVVRTGGGGLHLWYRVPEGLAFPKTLGRGVDLQSLGKYVVAPPSLHASGVRYEWIDSTAPIADAPPWLVALGYPRTEAKPVTEVQFDEELTEGLDRTAAVMLLAPFFVPGIRHNMSLAIGAFFKNRGYTPSDARALALELAAAAGSTDPDARANDAVNAFRYENPAGYSRLKDWIPEPQLTHLCSLVPDLRRTALEAQRQTLLAAAAPRPALEPANDGAPARDEQRSDLGNARRLVRLHGHDLRFFTARGIWYVWDGVRWAADETGAIVRLAKSAVESLLDDAKVESDDEKRKAKFAWAVKCQDKGRITNLVALAENEPGIPVTAKELDADPWRLNVANGVLDLRSGTLTAPDRSMLMTKLVPVPYVAGARSDLWENFIEKLTGGDSALAAYIQRALGYSLFGAWREKMFWFGYGSPDGGKSTLLGVIGDILGDYHVGADAATWMVQTNTGGNRGDVTRLLGARLVTTLEVRASARFDQQLMKKVTGGDALIAAAKYEGEMEFKPTFALWFGANDRPIIPDDDAGFWNRVRCVPFTHPVPKDEQDKALREKLASPDHAPGVLAWLVAGCLAWQRDGIGTCRAVEQATEDYRRSMNQAADFFDECCELTGKDDDCVNAGQLRAVYDAWCKSNGVQRPLVGKAWKRRLQELGVRGGDDNSKIRGHRAYRGLRLRETAATA